VTVRGSWAERYRPPSLHELYLPKVSIQSAVSDPRRGGIPAPITLVAGGNRDLIPTDGEVHSANVTFEPMSLPGLSLFANYWHVEVDDRIPVLTPTFLVANEAVFPGRIIRGAPTALDVLNGRPGAIVSVDTSRMNLGSLETSGIDASVRYDFDTGLGRWAPSLSATWIDDYDTVDVPGGTPQDRVNIANELGTIVRWRAQASLGWGKGPVSAFVTARYVPAYEDAVAAVRTGRLVDDQTTFDAQVSFDLGALASDDWLLRGMNLTVGALNITDELPQFAQVNALAGFDFSQGDLEGRFCYIRLGKTF
jgi:iron complex outermembrane receptor protein